MADSKIKLTKADRFKAFLRSYFLLASFNYERMQNGGVAYTLIPAIKKLYQSKEERAAALKRHLEFFNTQPFMANPIFGVTLALEEERANGADIDDAAISGVKVGMMGPLAGVGDPIFWGTLRPICAALGASLAMGGSLLGPILFFVLFNVVRLLIRWYGIKYGYTKGTDIIQDVAGNTLQKITEGASILGLFVMGALVNKWTTVNIPVVISEVTMQDGSVVTTTVQSILDQLMPGLIPLLLTFLCMKLMKKKVNAIWIIFGLFAVGIIGYGLGILK